MKIVMVKVKVPNEKKRKQRPCLSANRPTNTQPTLNRALTRFDSPPHTSQGNLALFVTTSHAIYRPNLIVLKRPSVSPTHMSDTGQRVTTPFPKGTPLCLDPVDTVSRCSLHFHYVILILFKLLTPMALGPPFLIGLIWHPMAMPGPRCIYLRWVLIRCVYALGLNVPPPPRSLF